jgi:hypothetical protein
MNRQELQLAMDHAWLDGPRWSWTSRPLGLSPVLVTEIFILDCGKEVVVVGWLEEPVGRR